MDFDDSDHTGEGILKAQVQELEMTKALLIAELGRIAEALGVEPSMVKVLAKIKELKDKP
jgi:hypothetical protein